MTDNVLSGTLNPTIPYLEKGCKMDVVRCYDSIVTLVLLIIAAATKAQ